MSVTATATANPFFTPTQISGCQLWFDGADFNTFSFSSGSNISQWRDKSSNSYVVNQAISASQPVFTRNIQNGSSGVQFQTISYLSNATSNMVNFTTGAATSVFVAARNASANSGWNIFNTIWFNAAGGAGTQRYHFSFNQSATPGTTLYANTALVGQVTSNAVSPNSNAILGFTASASLATIHTNGSSNGYSGVSLPDANNSNVFVLGENRNNTLLGSNVAIFEMIGYNTQVTTAERQQIEGYLAWKWGLQANLPATHPYKTSPIPPLLNPPITLPTAIGSPWSPIQISGSYVWLDASTSNNFTFASSSNISTWIDRSGNSYTATAANNPTWDSVNRRVRFSNTSSQYMSNTAAPLNLAQRSFFFVLEEITNTNVCGIMPIIPNPTSGNDYQTTTGLTIEGTTGFYFYGNNGGYANKINTTNPLAKAIYSEIYSNRNGIGYLNGTSNSSGSANYTPGTSSGFGLGGRWANGITTPYFNGYMYEIVVYNFALTTAQRQQVEGYLAWKWNLNGSLPANHPYKNYPTFVPIISLPARSIGVSANWQPTQITGCSLWFDATDSSSYVTSSNLVTTWTSKGTNTISVTQATSSNQPYIETNVQNKLNVMRFSNPNSANVVNLNNTSVASNVMTTGNSVFVFIVHNPAYTLNSPFSYQTGGGSRISVINPELVSGTYYMRWDWVDPVEGSGRLSYNVGAGYLTEGFKQECYYILNGGASTSEQGYRKNGTLLAAQSVGAGSFNATQTLTIGGFNPITTQYYYRLDIAEIIVFNQAISTFSVQQVEGYLAWKWGLQANLPATHPFKLFPPAPP